MKETLQSQAVNAITGEQPAPQGIGMAVAYDWGLTVELLVSPLLPLLLGVSSPFKLPTMSPVVSNLVTIVLSWLAATGIAFFGEGVRRGVRWTRPVQIAVNTLLAFAGFYTLWSFLQGIRVGNYWQLYPTILLLVVSPFIAWRLSRPVTAQWFATVTSAEARKRHGGAWVWMIALWAIVGGVLQAWVVFQQ